MNKDRQIKTFYGSFEGFSSDGVSSLTPEEINRQEKRREKAQKALEERMTDYGYDPRTEVSNKIVGQWTSGYENRISRNTEH